MRYFYLILLMLAVTVASLAGFRGSPTRRPPIEIFNDMARQPKSRSQTPSLPAPSNTIPAALPAWMNTQSQGTNGFIVNSFEDVPVNTGRQIGSTNWIEANPVPLSRPLLERGRERYRIFCAACHGDTGDGRGLAARYNMAGMANFHDKRLIDMPDGQMFDSISNGKNLMGAYGSAISANDRWAIIGFIRVMERSQLALPEDAPPDIRKLFIQE